MQMIIGKCVIDVDMAATRAYYAGYTAEAWNCDCAGCRNFVRAAEHLPEKLLGYLAALGLEPAKPAHLTPEVGLEGGAKILYTGWYDVCGTLPPDTKAVSLPDCEAQLTTDCMLLSHDVLRPLIQLHFGAVLPWLLDEPNTYV